MVSTAKANNMELTDEARKQMLDLTKAMEEALLHGLTEKEVTLEDGS